MGTMFSGIGRASRHSGLGGGKGQGSHPETQAATWRYLEDVMLKEAERHKSQILSDSVQGEGPDW